MCFMFRNILLSFVLLRPSQPLLRIIHRKYCQSYQFPMIPVTTSILVDFDKTQFTKVLNLLALRIKPKLCTSYLDKFKDYVFQLPKMKRIYEDPDSQELRLLVLGDGISDLNQLPQDLQDFHKTEGSDSRRFDITIDYDYLTVDEVLKKVLPDGVEIPSSFEQVGHIAHLNIRETLLPYKRIIGQVVMDKNPCIRTVVIKTANIETEFRTFPMEVIAGEPNFEVSVREGGATFEFNFKEVYWNSRLQMEHMRLANIITTSRSTQHHQDQTSRSTSTQTSQSHSISPADTFIHPNKKQKLSSSHYASPDPSLRKWVVADMTAGVGPFAIPLAKNGFTVHANDLNPVSFKYLQQNAIKNNCTQLLNSYNVDAREFIVDLVQRDIEIHEVIMNLPQKAIEFLDVFIGLFTRRISKTRLTSEGESEANVQTMKDTERDCLEKEMSLPRIHVYSFSTAEDPVADVIARVADVLQCEKSVLLEKRTIKDEINPENLNLQSSEGSNCVGYIVRDVAPRKQMVCLSFELPLSVALERPVYGWE